MNAGAEWSQGYVTDVSYTNSYFRELSPAWLNHVAAMQGAPTERRFWSDLLAIREVAAKQMEVMRANREIGASLDAEVTLYLDAKTRAELEPYADELRFFFITSGLTLDDDASAPAEAAPVDTLHDENRFASVAVRRSANPKCIRCWHHRADVGVDPTLPAAVEVVDQQVQSGVVHADVRRAPHLAHPRLLQHGAVRPAAGLP